MIRFEQLQFKRKGELVQCFIHKQQISQLNIGKNLNQGERLICDECNTLNHQVLYLNQTEKYLYKMYEEEQNNIVKEQQNFNETINLLKTEIKQLQKSFEIKFQIFEMQLKELKKQFSEMIDQLLQKVLNNQKRLTSEFSKTKISQLIETIAHSQTIDASILQQIAEFISNQNIVNGKLELKDKITIQDSTKKHIQHSNNWLSTQLTRIKAALENKTHQDKEKITRRMISIYDQQQHEQLDYDTFKYKGPILLYEHEDQIRTVALSNNNQLIASADYSGQMILWDLHSRAIKIKQNVNTKIQDLIFSLDDKLLAIAYYDDPFSILIFNLSNISSASPYIKLQGHKSTVLRIAFTSDSQYLISGSYDETIKIWSINQQKCIVTQKLSSLVFGVHSFSNYISAVCDDGQACLFDSSDISNINKLVTWKASDRSVYGTTFTQDSKMLLTYGEGIIKLWNINQLLSYDKQKLPVQTYEAENDSVFWSLSIRWNDSILISNDGKIRIWKKESGELIRTLNVPDGYSYWFDQNISVSRDMKYIITGGANAKLKIFELSTKQG